VECVSDEDGLCTGTGDTNAGDASVRASKDGYYGSGGYRINFTNVTGLLAFRRWKPWNPTIDVQMKKIGSPVPMYAKGIHQKLPLHDAPVAYDLEVGDWVKPHGAGKKPDMVFQMDRKPERTVPIKKMGLHGKDTLVLYHMTLTVRGSDDGDGFHLVPLVPVGHGASSALRMPREAPVDGYEASVVKRLYNSADRPFHTDVRDDANYFFRVRTKKDEEGKIVSALYGKIHGDFTLNHQGEVSFRYYLNPTPNDRNVEFDTERNLFPNIRVTMP